MCCGARALLGKYNHAWAAPGLTHGFSFMLSIGMVICIGAAITFGIQGRYTEVGLCVAVLLFYSVAAGIVNPTPWIRRYDLNDESDEIAQACIAAENMRTRSNP
jgi:Na+/melibiose symporter-like transporter